MDEHLAPWVYANQVELHVSQVDAEIIFSMCHYLDGDKITQERQVVVVLSVQLMKAMADLLPQYVQRYEQRHGRIRLEPTEDAPPPVEASIVEERS